MISRNIILGILTFVTAYDYLTTISGTIDILGVSIGSIVASIVLSTVIGGMLLYTFDIHANKEEGPFQIAFKALWLLAFLYDIWTSFTGNAKFIIEKDLSRLSPNDWKQLLLLGGLTIFVSSCPVILSFSRNNEKFMSGKIL